MEEDIYKSATKKVKAKKGFMYHFIAYVCTLAMMYTIMHFEQQTFLPVYIVGLAWGIGIGIHYFNTFGTENLDFLGISENWEEKELTNEIDKLRRKRELREELQKEKMLLAKSERLDLDNLDKEIEALELREIEKKLKG